MEHSAARSKPKLRSFGAFMSQKKGSLSFIAGILVFCLGVQTAYADLFGGDLPLLSAIVTNTAQQLTKLSETLSTLRKTYEDAKRVASYADDAYKAYQHFSRYSSQVFRDDVTRSFENAYPDIAYFRREASSGPQIEGSGGLDRLLSYCLAGRSASQCVELQQALSLQQARNNIAAVFGSATAVAGYIEMKSIDDEAGLAVAASSSQIGRDQIGRAQAENLQEQCTGDADDGNLAACQAAGSLAQIQALKQSTELTDQVAELNRLQALRLAQENAKRKREIGESIERREIILEAAQNMTPPPPQLRAEGLDVFEGEGT
jgi:hypothetical protein